MSSPSKSSAALPSLTNILTNNFDSGASNVVANHQTADWKMLVFGRIVSDAELAGLCGAPSNSTLTLSRSGTPTSPGAEQTPDGIKVIVRNTNFFQHDVELIFYTLPKGKCGVYIKLVVTKNHPSLAYVAGLMLCRMLEQMDAVPSGERKFAEIRMLAAGGRNWLPMKSTGERWSGWMVWPKYGFDMQLTKLTTDIFPKFKYVPRFASAPNGCDKVSDLLSIDKGLEFWDIVGDGSYMDFDTTPGSSNRKTLLAFMNRKYQ